MQKPIAFILSLIFLVQSFNQGFCYLDYILRRADYEKQCINKALPQMHCNGKCQLMKKIMEQEKKEQQQAPEMKYAGKVEVLPTQILSCAEKPAEKKRKSLFYSSSSKAC